MKKSYLSAQIRLMSINTYDLMTDEEWAKYKEIIDVINQMNRAEDDVKEELGAKRKELSNELAELIKRHDNSPRCVRLENITNPIRDLPQGVSWYDLKQTRQISEFVSDGSRAMGLEDRSITFDKIIVKWKNLDILEQIVMNGFDMMVATSDGEIVKKHYIITTASAGQLRTDKVQALSTEGVQMITPLECGITDEVINKKGGINQNKFLAYSALPFSATDPWPDFNIDEVIVIDDFEANVTGRMLYITNEYEHVKGINTVPIKHTDGSGMMLPNSRFTNVMIRGPYIKGLLTTFDYIKFCKVHGVPPVIKDVWGQEHDLIKENIKIILCKSQLKLWNYYESWDHYKTEFKRNNCHMNLTNYEEAYAKDVPLNYQFLQTLIDMTDEEIDRLIKPTYDYINAIARSKRMMLRTLGADENTSPGYQKALALYPELLHEAYSRESLRSIKRRLVLDARSGKLVCRNKRLYVIPDMYAACQYWFLGIKEPEGLVKPDEVVCREFFKASLVDILRSPSLYFEHNIRKVCRDPAVYEWFPTNAIVTGCKDLISRVLQFDVDGDQLNVTDDETVISVAQRMIEKYDIVPLYYNSFKAAPEMMSRTTMFNGLKRAHDYSGIGEISNMLTRLWNKDHPDFESAADITLYNNQVIDGAKTAKIIPFENFPKVAERIQKAAGSSRSRMPFFFQFTKNGRKQTDKPKQYQKPNNSVMNRICARFMKMPNINMNLAGVAPFNWQMMVEQDVKDYNITAIKIFCDMDIGASARTAADKMRSIESKVELLDYDLIAENIVHELEANNITIEDAYPSIVKYLFTGNNATKIAHKQMFWRVFGDHACKVLARNLATCHVCPNCKTRIPTWVTDHACTSLQKGFLKCIDCGQVVERRGPRQCRCIECEAENRRIYLNRVHNARNKARRQQGGMQSA